MKNDIVSIKTLYDKLHDVHRINNGGCGVAALAVHRAAELLRLSHQILCLYLDIDVDAFNLNLSVVSNGNYKDFMVPYHIAIYDTSWNRVVDSTGTVTTSGMYEYMHSIHEIELVKMLNLSTDWNDTFNRKEQIPVIESILKVDLSDIDKETK